MQLLYYRHLESLFGSSVYNVLRIKSRGVREWYRMRSVAPEKLRNSQMLFNLTKCLLLHSRPQVGTDIDRATCAYVNTSPAEGYRQLQLLIYEGCEPTHRVLEVGCGALMAGYPIMQYLHAGHYVGIEPNRWLIDNSCEIPQIREAIERKKGRFLHNDRFDATSLDERFDFVISHSVVSHLAHWQLPLFLQNLSRVLTPGGRILASLRFYEGNHVGSTGYQGSEEDFKEWQYPGVSYFKRSTVERIAAENNFEYRIADDYLNLMVKARRWAIQDWVVLTKRI